MAKPTGGFTPDVRNLILTRTQSKCDLCGIFTDSGQFHHRRPRGMGGSKRGDTGGPENALYLHQGCHEKVERDRKKSYINGWLVPQVHSPAAVAVKLWNGWHQLNPDGSVTNVPSQGT